MTSYSRAFFGKHFDQFEADDKTIDGFLKHLINIVNDSPKKLKCFREEMWKYAKNVDGRYLITHDNKIVPFREGGVKLGSIFIDFASLVKPDYMKVGGCKGVSFNRYWTNELISGVQKYIRRDMPDKAVYCSAELCLFAFVKDRGEGPTTKLLNRLLVIVLEDVGISNISLIKFTLDLYKETRALQDKRGKAMKKDIVEFDLHDKINKNIFNMVMALSRSRHGRFVSHYRATFKLFLEDRDKMLMLAKKYTTTIIPIYEYIMKHEKEDTIKMFKKSMNASFGTVERKSLFYWGYIYQMRGGDLFELVDGYDLKEYSKLLSDKRDGDAMLPWNLLLVILTNKEIIKWNATIPKYNHDWEEFFLRNLNREKIDFDSFVTDDKHVNKFVKDGTKKFKLYGSHVENESPLITSSVFEIDMKSLYIKSGLTEDELCKLEKESKLESEMFTLRARIQLVCGAGKTDTYFAYRGDKPVFVKGPYRSDKEPKTQVYISEIKKKIGLPYLTCNIEYIVADLLPPPHRGFRGSKLFESNVKYPFLVVEDKTFMDKDPLIQVKKYSNDPTPIEVVDFSDVKDGMPLTNDIINEMDDKLMGEFVLAVIFRYVLGIPDLALRNFIKSGSHIYSVDEDVMYKFDSFKNGVPIKTKGLIDKIKKFIRENDYIEKTVRKWEIEKVQDRLVYVKENLLDIWD